MPTTEIELVEEVCEQCRSKFWRRPGRKKHLCHECKIGKAESAAVANIRREGPSYEKLVRSQFRHWRGELKRLGLKA